jgi:hypothetical protein
MGNERQEAEVYRVARVLPNRCYSELCQQAPQQSSTTQTLPRKTRTTLATNDRPVSRFLPRNCLDALPLAGVARGIAQPDRVKSGGNLRGLCVGNLFERCEENHQTSGHRTHRSSSPPTRAAGHYATASLAVQRVRSRPGHERSGFGHSSRVRRLRLRLLIQNQSDNFQTQHDPPPLLDQAKV